MRDDERFELALEHLQRVFWEVVAWLVLGGALLLLAWTVGIGN